MFGIGQPEVILVLFIVLLLFGTKSLPKMARTLGDSIRSLRDGFTDGEGDKSLKDITNEVASSARDIRSSIDEIKRPLNEFKGSVQGGDAPAPEQQNS